MGFIDKLKNVFFEEVEEDDEEIEVPKNYAKKVEIPKKVNIKEEVREKELEKEVEKEKREEPKEEVKEEKELEIFDSSKTVPMMFDDDDFLEEESVSFEKPIFEEKEIVRHDYDISEKNAYNEKKSDVYSNQPLYSYTKTTYNVEKETKVFKPSPIISPIYGILDKNYRKEEVVTKRETRISGNYKKPDLDSVRNKALGNENNKKETPVKTRKYSFEEDEVYDVNNSKPQVSKVTLADADEYYNDLGLAYNVDYSDASRKDNTRTYKYANKDKKKNKKDVDDNLFDLIDSMYNKED